MSITKSCIIDSIQKVAGLNRCRSARSVEATIEIIKKTLESDEVVMISGFGKFSIENNSKRRFTNPNNGNAYIPDANRIVTFKSSPVLLKKINSTK